MRCSDRAISLGHLILVALSFAKVMAYFQVKYKNRKKWQQIDRYKLSEDLFQWYKNMEDTEEAIRDIEKGEIAETARGIYRRDPTESKINHTLTIIQERLKSREKDWKEYVERYNKGKLDLRWMKKEFPEIVEMLGRLKRKDVWRYGYIPAAIIFGRFMK